MNEVDPHYDPDLQAALEIGGESALREAREVICTCGHTRRDHFAATGALGGFGGSACEQCWGCGTFNQAENKSAEGDTPFYLKWLSYATSRAS